MMYSIGFVLPVDLTYPVGATDGGHMVLTVISPTTRAAPLWVFLNSPLIMVRLNLMI